MYGIALIFVLILTGGAIAFIGDKLGSKIGKKKMTVLGLRPRHTSMLITVITGILITAVTLIVMSVMSDNVRTALFGMEELNQNMEQARVELAEASAELAMAKAEQEKIRGDLDKATRELAGLEKQKNTLEQRTQELQSVNDRLESDNHDLQQKSDKLTRINDILEEGNERLSKSNSELYQINRELTTGIRIMREGSIAFRAGETLAVGIVKGGGSLDETHAEMGRILEMARYTVISRLNNNAPESEKDIWIYQPDFEKAADYISQNDGEFVVRLVAAGNLIQGESVAVNLQLFTNKIVYQDNQLITEERVKFNPKDTAELQGVLTDFLSGVNAKARKDGILPDSLNGSVGVIDSEQIYGVLGQMQKSNGSAIISAFAEGATNIIGPLRIKLKLSGMGLLHD